MVLRRYAVLATVSSSYPLHQAVSQTLLTRPPLVSEAASCFLLPFDLHVLGLPPAFNLSHDQTLQFKFDARELNFVMNYVFTQRLGIRFSSEDVKNPYLRVPTQIV